MDPKINLKKLCKKVVKSILMVYSNLISKERVNKMIKGGFKMYFFEVFPLLLGVIFFATCYIVEKL